MAWYPLASEQELLQQPSREFQLSIAGAEVELFVVNHEGELYAYINSCPHTGVVLNWQPDVFFDADERHIQCSIHGALFNPNDGQCVYGPCRGDALTPLKLRIVESDVEVFCNEETLSDQSRSQL